MLQKDDPKVIMISPDTIRYAMIEEFQINEYTGEVLDGDWDRKIQKFDDRIDFYESFKMRLKDIPWQETPYFERVMREINQGYEKWGCTTEEQFLNRCIRLEGIYLNMKENGYIQNPDKDYAAVNIGRDGEIIFNNGRHRICFAKILNIPEIPVKITVRHSEWNQFREKVLTYASKHNGVVYAPLKHPDLKDIPSLHAGRFPYIKKHINPDSKTVLDIGTHWGYMCSKLEEECGKECFAIENGKGTFYYLEKIRKANEQNYHTIFANIFDFTRKYNKFDTVLALAIFHHFIKTPELHQELVDMLNRLEMKEMFLQAHRTDEPQMQGVYRNYSPDEFAQFIVDNSCLTHYKEICDFEGRKLFHIYKKETVQIGRKSFKGLGGLTIKTHREAPVKESQKLPPSKKVMFLGFVNGSYPQILNKIYNKYKAFKKIHNNTELLLIGKGDDKLPADLPFKYYDIRKIMPKANFLQTMQLSVSIVNSLIDEMKPDYIYMRYPLANEHTVSFVKKHKNLIVEFQTKQFEEFEKSSPKLLNLEKQYCKEFLSNIDTISAVTKEIADYEKNISGKNIPTFIFTNGVDVSSRPENDVLQEDIIHIAYVSMYAQYWQGIDRILYGISNSNAKNIKLHFIGNVTDDVRSMINQLGLNNIVELHGVMDEKGIDSILQKCSVGIGAMAVHRKGLKEAAAIKLRDYCSRGIPFVYSGDDSDFSTNLPFVHQYPLNDEPLDFSHIIKLAKEHNNSESRKKIRDYALSHLDWNVKAEKIMSFLYSLDSGEPIVDSADEYNTLRKLATNLKADKGNLEITKQLIAEMLRKKDEKITSGPLVSVVIPYYMQPETIVETLLSVYNQSYRNFEVILVNDGDTKEVEDVVNNNAQLFPDLNLKYFRKENEGLAATRNFGISKAEGKYVLPLDSDDMLASDFLKETVNYLEQHKDIDFVFTETLFYGAKNEIWAFRDFDPSYLIKRNMMTCTTLFRKEVWVQTGGYRTNMKHGYEDWDFWITASENGFKGGNIHLPLFLYRRKKDSMLENRVKYDHIAKAQIVKNHPNIFIQNHPQEEQLLKEKIGLIPEALQKKPSGEEPEQNRNSFSYPDMSNIKQELSARNLTPSNQMLSGSKPRILFVCHNFPPHKYGGAQLYAMHLAKKINELGIADVEILYPLFRGEIRQFGLIETEFEGLKVFQLAKDFSKGFELAVRHPYVEKVFDKFLSMRHYDAIHFHGLGQLTPVPIEVAYKKGIKTVMTFHEHWFLCFFWFLMSNRDSEICSGPESIDKCTKCVLQKYQSIPDIRKNYNDVRHFIASRFEYYKMMFDIIDYKFAPSQYLINKFEEYDFRGIQVNNLGMEPMEYVAKKKHSGIRFGIIGQISPRKGTDILLRAFQSLSKSEKDKLHVHGKCYFEGYMNMILQMISTTTGAEYQGAYTPEDLPHILSEIDVLIVPSLWENYPLVVQEAFLCKVPVITSNTGGFPEVVKHGTNGLLFKAGSYIDLAEKMQYILDNPNKVLEFSNNIKPVKTLTEDAEYYTSLYKKKIERCNDTKFSAAHVNSISPEKRELKNLTVQFYMQKSVHWPIYENLYEHVKLQPEVDKIVFCIPRLTEVVNSGYYDEISRLIDKVDEVVMHPADANADVTFIASTVQGKVWNCGKVVSIGHGTISKGFFFSDNVWVHRENWVDLLCVPGNYAYQLYKKILSTNIAATGMPKLDSAFNKDYDKSYLCQKYNLDPNKKIVLYAPTFNTNLSSVYNFAERFHELDQMGFYTLVKLHGTTLPRMFSHYRALGANFSNIVFVEESNLAYLLAGSDIMISDVSSAFMEFMALDKPVILYNNPERFQYHGFHETDIEWAWRDLGTQINSFDELLRILPGILRNGDGKSAIRKKYAETLLADLEGKASERVWNAVREVLPAESTVDVSLLSFVIVVTDDNWIVTRTQIQACDKYFRVPMEIVVVRNGVSDETAKSMQYLIDYHEYINFRLIDIDETSWHNAFERGVEDTSGNIVFTMKENAQLFSNFDFVLEKTFRKNPEVQYLTGISTNPDSFNFYEKYIKKEGGDKSDHDFSYDVYNHFKGEEVSELFLTSIPEFFAFRKDAVSVREVFSSRKISIALSLLYHESNMTSIMKYWNQRDKIPPKEFLESMLDVLTYYIMPDLAQYIVDEYVRGHIDEALMFKALPLALSGRYYDINYKKHLINVVKNEPIRKTLQSDLDLISRIGGKRKSNTSLKNGFSGKKALFYFFKNVHIPILEPVYRKLKELHPEIEIGFSIMEYAPQIRAGFTPSEREYIVGMGERVYASPQAFKPDITFIADSIYPIVKGCGKIVNIGHGVLSKGQYYTDTPVARREEEADLVCVPGKFHEDIMRKIISTPVKATGMAKLDPVFSGEITRESVINKYGLPADKKYILFAPTFNDELSALPYLADRINEVIPDDNTIMIVKLHGSTAEHYKHTIRELVSRDIRIVFAEADEYDITPFMALADVLISDFSSAMMEFAALDKPVVLFNNPKWRNYKYFNPNDIGFKWRDIGIEVKSIEETKYAVEQCFASPEFKSDIRKKYTDQLFANKYGRSAAEAIINESLTLLN